MADFSDTIGDWSSTELTRFVQQLIQADENVTAPNRTFEEVNISRKLTIDDELAFTQSQTTVGTAGAASAPPASPELYVKVLGPDGQVRLIPLYKAS